MPVMKFIDAIRDSYVETMRAHPEVFLMGVGIIDPKAVFGSVKGIREEFGEDRFVEGPLAEQMLTGMAFGASLMGLRPVLIHHRVDFLPLTADQIVSHFAKWKFMFGGQQKVPTVIRGIVGRGWGNGPQHTQSLIGLFAGVPGLKIAVPSNPADAKGLMTSAILDDEPVIFIDFRWLHNEEAEVPSGLYKVPLGKANILTSGKDCTVVALGPMVEEALKVARLFAKSGIHLEVIDLRTARPIDFPTVAESVRKTGRLVIADPDWPHAGVSATLISQISQTCFESLKTAPVSINWPNHPVPASYGIEPTYYPSANEIAQGVARALNERSPEEFSQTTKFFEGPF